MPVLLGSVTWTPSTVIVNCICLSKDAKDATFWRVWECPILISEFHQPPFQPTNIGTRFSWGISL